MPDLSSNPLPWVVLGLVFFWTLAAAALPLLRRPAEVRKLGEASMNFDSDGFGE